MITGTALNSLHGILLNEMKIPKIIYSTWISDKPLPEKFSKYIRSWKTFLPDFEIRMITLDNVPRNIFTNTFIDNKKFAVAAQYARALRIFETGGLYFDIDVEAVKSFDMLLDFEMFAGIESKKDNYFINNALFGACKGHLFMKDYMDRLNEIDFTRKDIEIATGPLLFTELMKQRGWIPGNKNSSLEKIQIFRSEYFYPYCPDEQFKQDCITRNTYAVHHWAATWKNSVSIIILSSEELSQLNETIENARSQSVKAIEIILLNNTFKENSKRLKTQAEKSKIKLIDSNDSGSSSAKNAAVEFAKGKWILILKPGDRIHPEFIERTIDKGDIVGLNFGNGIISNGGFSQNDGHLMFRKEVWEKINGFDETMIDGYADDDFLNRAKSNGFNLTIVDADKTRNQSNKKNGSSSAGLLAL